jgi:glycosyltransferase involved in cell wall biosynthesis
VPKAFLAYGTVARESLLSQGVLAEKIFIAQNTIQSDDSINPLNPDSVDLAKMRLDLGIGQKKVILYAGAFEKRKKIDFLIELFEFLNRDDILMIILGDGPDDSRIRRLIKRKNLEKKILLPGRIIEGRAQYFYMADLYVIPSQWGFVNLPLSYGLPVVVNKNITEYELISDGKNGFLCDDDDLNSYACHVNQLLDNPEFARQMGKEGYQTFNEEANFDKMLKGIEHAIQFVLSSDG